MDIYSIGDGQFLEQVVQAVTLASGSGEFATMAKIGILFGVILIGFQALRSGGRDLNFTQIGIAGLLYALAFGSTQTVTITDAYTQDVRVVDNVPTGVAATGSFLTSIGFNLTELFETSFSTPTMTEQGYGFSLDVLKRVRMNTLTVHHLGVANAAKPGSDFYESWSQYIKTCTLIGMELGFIKRDDLFRAPDFISGLRFESPNFAAKIQTEAAPETLTCTPAHDLLDAYTRTSFLPTFKQEILPAVLDLDPPAGAAEVEEVINDALNGLGVGPAPQSNFTTQAPPVTADDFIISSVLVPIYYEAVRERYIQDGKFAYAETIDDAVRARNSQWMANQSLFDRFLRPMLTFIEGFVFAATPILSLLIPIGALGIGAVGRFLLVGAWIQLWMPALAIVNLFIHDIVAGKMTAIADAGTPLTSLAGLFHGDDIIQTWLATGGLMASAVPVLTLMLVYGGAISANFFATRLQGEDVVMERQASGSAMNPVERLHIDPLATHNPTVGLPMQTGASARLPAYNISSRVGQMEESAFNASQQASEQFESRLTQSVGETWAKQQLASIGQSGRQGLTVEGGQVESAVRSQFNDLVHDIHSETGATMREATNWTLRGSLGASIPKLALGASGELTDTENKIEQSSKSEQWKQLISDKMANSAETRASITEAVAADIVGNTSDAYISSDVLGQDENLVASAQDVLSASKAYNVAESAGAALEGARHLNAENIVPAILANPDARDALHNVIEQYGLDEQVAMYKEFAGARDLGSFMGNEDALDAHAELYVASQQIGSGEENSAHIAAGVADVLELAEGVPPNIGDAGRNRGLMDSTPHMGTTAHEVRDGLEDGLAGLPEYQQNMSGVQQEIHDLGAGAASANQANHQAVEEQKSENTERHIQKTLENSAKQKEVFEQVDTETLNAPGRVYEYLKDKLHD